MSVLRDDRDHSGMCEFMFIMKVKPNGLGPNGQDLVPVGQVEMVYKGPKIPAGWVEVGLGRDGFTTKFEKGVVSGFGEIKPSEEKS